MADHQFPLMVTTHAFLHSCPTGLWHMNSHRHKQRSKRHLQKQQGSMRRQPFSPTVIMPSSGMAAGGGAGGLGGPINFASFDEKSWARFKRELLCLVDTHIRDGKWRQSSRQASIGGVAMSCPRF